MRLFVLLVLIGLYTSCTDCGEVVRYRDADRDGFGTPDEFIVDCDSIVGFVSNNIDEDDNCNPRDWSIFFEDLDNDGLGNRLIKQFNCFNEDTLNLVTNGLDNNDLDPNIGGFVADVSVVLDFLSGFEITTPESLENLDEEFIQHSVEFADGAEGYRELFEEIDKGNEVATVNFFYDEPFVIAHILYGGRWNEGVSQVALEVFRVEDGLIIEHWDNVENFTNPLQRPEEINLQADDSELNQQIIAELNDSLFIARDTIPVDSIFASNFFDHSSQAISLDDLRSIESLPTYAEIEFIHGVGNVVLAMIEGEPDQDGTILTYFDLYVFNDGLITERWQTIQLLPNAFAHTNGKW